MVLALAIEAACWMPFVHVLATFVLLQRLAMIVAGAVALDVLLSQAWTAWTSSARAWRTAVPALAGLGILCWLPACEVFGEMATMRDAQGIMHDHARALQAVNCCPACDATRIAGRG